MDNRSAALEVLRTLRSEGYLALFAGGCVRDMLLGREPKDYDVATNAHPEVVSSLFRRTIEVGAQFGVVMVMVNDHQIEVATFRTESGYVDGRRPGKIEFTDAREDALRRDFTINGMFYDPLNDEVLDYVGGREDLEKKIIRTIGDPAERFGEDYLRMLRAIRFATQLNFEIENATWMEVCRQGAKIADISGERIAIELENTFQSVNRDRGARLFIESGLAGAVFSDVPKEVFSKGREVLSNLSGEVDLPCALAGLFHACKAKDVLKYIEVLKLSRKYCQSVQWMLENLDMLLKDDLSLGQFKVLLSNRDFWNLYNLQLAIEKSRDGDLALLEKRREKAFELEDTELLPSPLLSGYDFIELGVAPGPRLGELSQELYMLQLNEEIVSREGAEKWVKRRLKD